MTLWRVSESDFVWGDLPPAEEAARIASKHPYKSVPAGAAPDSEPAGLPPDGFMLQTSRAGPHLVLVRRVEPTAAPGVGYLVTHQYGVRDAAGVETWAPLGSEGPSRPDITVGTVRDLCGVADLERKVAALESQVRALQAQAGQYVNVRTG